MALPKPPKTNACRFLACLGLILVLAALVVPWQYQESIEDARDILLAAVGRSDLYASRWFEAYLDAQRGGRPTEAGLDRLRNESIGAQVALIGATEEFNRVLRNHRDWSVAAVAGALSGFAIMMVGFMLWSRRLRRWQESIYGLQIVAPAETEMPDVWSH